MTKPKRTGAKATGTTTKRGGSKSKAGKRTRQRCKYCKEWKKVVHIKKHISQQIWKEFHKAGLHRLEVYIHRRQNALAQHLATRPIHQLCIATTRLHWRQHLRVQPPPETLPPNEAPTLLDASQPPPPAALPPEPERIRASLPSPRPIPPPARDLSFREDALVVAHLSRSHGTLDDASTPPSAPCRVNRRGFLTLRPKTWVSDEAIAGYLAILLAHHNHVRNSTRRCAAFSPHFITHLLQMGHANPRRDGKYHYPGVKRWGGRRAHSSAGRRHFRPG